MRCPTCMTAFDHAFDYRQGIYAEHECSCGQLLQWDYTAVDMSRPGQVRLGPPQPCQHDEDNNPGALVPLP